MHPCSSFCLSSLLNSRFYFYVFFFLSINLCKQIVFSLNSTKSVKFYSISCAINSSSSEYLFICKIHEKPLLMTSTWQICMQRDSLHTNRTTETICSIQAIWVSKMFHKSFYWHLTIRWMIWINNCIRICLEKDVLIQTDVQYQPHSTYHMSGLIIHKCKICTLTDMKWHHILYRKFYANFHIKIFSFRFLAHTVYQKHQYTYIHTLGRNSFLFISTFIYVYKTHTRH